MPVLQFMSNKNLHVVLVEILYIRAVKKLNTIDEGKNKTSLRINSLKKCIKKYIYTYEQIDNIDNKKCKGLV